MVRNPQKELQMGVQVYPEPNAESLIPEVQKQIENKFRRGTWLRTPRVPVTSNAPSRDLAGLGKKRRKQAAAPEPSATPLQGWIAGFRTKPKWQDG